MSKSLSQELRNLEATNPTVREAAARYDAAMARLTQNIHQVYVSTTTIRCTISCSGPAPHLDEYRAVDTRPTTAATEARKAHDEQP